ncbi:hypothetical protein [Streptomyces mirabilis]|uniref:hypothetical protein n=1 Tax=Streptomyces mirabilis TaxID=68239 RepID=UPI0033A5B2DD
MFVEHMGVFMLKRLRPLAVAAAMLLSFATLGEARAADGSDSLQQQIDDVLAKTDGGVQISRNEIAWNGGEVIMAFPLPGEAQAPVSSPAAQRLQAEVPGVAADATEQPPADESESDSSTTASDSCPTEVFGNDWYCFYQYKNFGGRRLQWNAKHVDRVFFSAYDFVNRTSSWSNKGGLDIYVMGRTVSGVDDSCSTPELWREGPHSRSTSLPSSLDNKADCFAAV